MSHHIMNNMNITNITDIILSFLNKYKYSIAVFVYFQAIVYFQIIGAWYRGHYLFYFVNAASLFLILHIISKSKFIICVALTVIFSLLFTIEAYYGLFFKSNITLGFAFAMLDTNITESASIMGGRIIHSIVLFCITFFGIFKSAGELKRMNIKAKWSVIALALYLFVCFPLYLYRKIRVDEEFASAYKIFPLLHTQKLITERSPLMYGQLSAVVVYLDEKNKLKKYLLQDRMMPEGIVFNDTADVPEKIYFVIGESQYRNHLSLYGYDIKTTPFLDSLFQSSANMLVYDGISPASFTTFCMRMILTFATPLDPMPLIAQKNIVELANEAGFQTVWLSNQPTFGPWDDGFVWQASSLSHDVFYTGNSDENTLFMDLDLIPFLRAKYQNGVKQFFLIQLNGSHYGYSDKYDDIDKLAIQGNDMTTHYNRSIHHTDRVLREIYHVMKDNTSSVLYYISDHGENIELRSHGMVHGGFCQYDVPMFIINQSTIDVESVVDKYFLHDKNRINTFSSTNILAELMGYSVSDEVIANVREHSYYIHHADGRAYKFYELE